MDRIPFENEDLAGIGQDRLLFLTQFIENFTQTLCMKTLRCLSLIHFGTIRNIADLLIIHALHNGIGRRDNGIAGSVLFRIVDVIFQNTVCHKRTNGIVGDNNGFFIQSVKFFDMTDRIHDRIIAGRTAFDHIDLI